ncbi:FG-GAP-like repeat-containing protein [Streptomyces sp. NPDC058861]|uniref:FG-GAP-like repeat-containing protein n=1 Tax=Streptomyces sp. NPDC058861 TaxID=3346653 RepID=UPI00367DF578
MRIRRTTASVLGFLTAAVMATAAPSAGAINGSPSTATSAAQTADADAPSLEAVFNHPRPIEGGHDRTIEDKLVELIRAAKAGSGIRASMYMMEDEKVVDALIAAHRANVDVRVLSERCRWKGTTLDCALPLATELPQADRLAQALGNAPDGKPKVILCQRGCMQNTEINHDKFWLFSALGAPEEAGHRTNVVVQSSHNLDANHQTPGLADNMVISSNDAQIYQGYEKTWNVMRASELANTGSALWPEIDATGAGDFSGHAGKVAGWRYPRNAVAPGTGVLNDPVARDIRALDCATGPQVHIAMASWGGRDEVDTAIAEKADDPGANGKRCTFEIVTAGSPQHALDLERPNRNVTVRAVTAHQQGTVASGGLHSKYVLLSWDDADGTPHRVVHTGSVNFNNAGVTKADESSLRIIDGGIYAKFRENWQELRDQNDLDPRSAHGLTGIPFLYEYSAAPLTNQAQPFTFGSTEAKTFRTPKSSQFTTPAKESRKTAKGDFNGDRLLDLAVLNDEGTSPVDGKKWMSLETFLGKPDGRYSKGTKSWTANSSWGWYTSMRLTSGDYNGDGRDDVAALYTYAGSGDVWAFYTFPSRQDGTFDAPRRALDGPAGWSTTSRMQIVSGDFDGDGLDDIAALRTEVNGALGLHTFIAQSGNTFRAPSRSWYVSNQGKDFWGSGERTRIVSGDFNGDGRDDIAALYGYESGDLGLHTFLSQTDGGFAKPVPSWRETSAWGSTGKMKLTTGDFNGDGRDDIASLYGYEGTGSTSVHLFGAQPSGKFDAPYRGWNGTSHAWAGIQLPPS